MDMNMAATSTMSDMAMGTATAAAASATTTTAKSMSMGGSCKISMLWNWYTIDSCFISSTWHITSRGMFAGSCIGVIFLVMSLEFLRRLSKEYDRYIIKQARAKFLVPDPHSSEENLPGKTPTCASVSTTPACRPNTSFKPNLLQQMIRATLHMLQFAVAYFVMLLAMYYNGYIIICIFIGAWIGGFIFQWETISLTDKQQEATICCG